MVVNSPFNNIYEMKRWMWDHDTLKREENIRFERTMNIVKSVFIKGNVALKNRYISNDGEAQGLNILAGNTEAQFNINVGLLNGVGLRFWDVGSSNYIELEAPALVANQTFILPATDGLAGNVLGTNGAGTLLFLAGGGIAAPGADTQVIYNNSGFLAAEAAFTYNYNTNTLTADSIRATVDCSPSAADNATLGTVNFEWSDGYFADGSVIYFGNDQDVTLTHIPDTGLILNSNMQLQFRDNAIHIRSEADGHLDITADTIVDLNSDLHVTRHAGIYTAPANNIILRVLETGVNTVDSYYAIYASFEKTAGVTNAADNMYGMFCSVDYNHNGSTCGHIYGQLNIVYVNGGGPSVNTDVQGFAGQTYLNPNGLARRDLYGIYGFTYNSGGTCSRDFQGLRGVTYLDTGTVTGSAYGCYNRVQVTSGATLSTNMYGVYIATGINNGATFGGTAYAVYVVDNYDNVQADWCFYQVGTSQSRFGGHLQVDGDNTYVYWGASQDCGIIYDGTNMEFYANLVGTGYFDFVDAGLRINTGSADSDTTVNGTSANLLFCDASSNRIGIGGTSTPENLLDIYDGNLQITTPNGSATRYLKFDNKTLGVFDYHIYGDASGLTFEALKANNKMIFNEDGNFTLAKDSVILGFGVDTDVTITHVHNTGLLINSTSQLQFRDSAIYIASLTDGHLDLTADISIDANGDVVCTEDIFTPSDKQHQFGGALDTSYGYIEFDTATAPDEFIIEVTKADSNLRIKNNSMDSISAEIILETAVSTNSTVGIRFVGDDWNGNDWGSAGAGNYRFLLIDENGRLVVSDTDKNISGA